MNARAALLPLCGGLCLVAATPPRWFPGAEGLLLVGLAVWFVLATQPTAPRWRSYLLGCVHMACFSWSVRHVLLPAYFAIVLLGGLYYLWAARVVRGVSAAKAPLAFAVAVAASFWLRAVMPEIHYPHGQPCHALWQWPDALAVLRIGGEPLANALLAGLAAALVTVWRAWQRALVPLPRALGSIGLWLVAWVCLMVLGSSAAPASGTLRIAVVEPGVHALDAFLPQPGKSPQQQFRDLFAQRWLEPTRELLAQQAVDLVLWPESSLPIVQAERDLQHGADLTFGLPLGTAGLLYGTNLAREVGSTPIALLVGEPNAQQAALRGWHEKQVLVPGGEFLPFARWLPAAARQWVYDGFATALGSAPDCATGRWRAPLLWRDVPFGALTCYDNAFPEPAAAQVAAGARWLAVLSNESWYRGGGELDQLVAMTVCRALECGVPVVRATSDGWSVAVGADGKILAAAARRPAPQASPQTLVVDLPLPAAAAVGPVSLRRWLGPLLALLAGGIWLVGSWLRPVPATDETGS